MARWGTWRGRRGVASTAAFSMLVAGPVALAVIHEGFPVTDVTLRARDVWVTSTSRMLAGRLNMQIEELNGSVSLLSRTFDILQGDDDVFVYDDVVGSVERVDPAFTNLVERFDVTPGSQVARGGTTLAVLDPSDGALRATSTAGEIVLDSTVEPLGEFDAGAAMVVTQAGDVVVADPGTETVYRFAGGVGEAEEVGALAATSFELSAVGDRAVVLDLERSEVAVDGGRPVALGERAMRLQQVGPDRDFVLVASGEALLVVGLDGKIERIEAGVAAPVTSPEGVSAPVALGECVHGAWSGAERYVGRCGPGEAVVAPIPGSRGEKTEFRVNRDVIALNSYASGDVWLPSADLRLVENWDEVTPPEEEEGEEGAERASRQSFEETLAERTEQNSPPVARPDTFGVRPGKITTLPPLDNDTDADGDVLTVISTSDIPPTSGTLQYIDGGRALQFAPAEGASGTTSFRYTVSDGRPGGVDESTVDVTIRPYDLNEPPVMIRQSAVAVEAGQSVGYNVLADWTDPDGDDLLLVAAEVEGGDVVRFTPDGQVTFTHRSSETGVKAVTLVMSDGQAQTAGELVVDVRPAGTLDPVGVPDFAETFIDQDVVVEPLRNDISPSGAALELVSVEPLGDAPAFRLDPERGTVTVSAPLAGVYYLTYGIAAGSATSIGLIRVDVVEDPDSPLPPVAVADTAYLRVNEPALVPALRNDVSPSGRVLGIQSVDVPWDAPYNVEVLGSTMLRVSASAPLKRAHSFSYTISDGISTAVGSVAVVPVPELPKHQAPIATDDRARVRAGDIATVNVLANDEHPDGARMAVERELVEVDLGEDGLAFVSDDKVRIQAPSVPGRYEVAYRISDAYGESATARIEVTVVEHDHENNSDPIPVDSTAVVFAGASIGVVVPLDGVDPDGDSVSLVGVSGATLGTVSDVTSRGFSYEAYPDSAGTDTLTYRVRDSFGGEGTAVVRIGVIPRPAALLPPRAVDDNVHVLPESTASVRVLANDSDPNGFAVSLQPELLEVQDGIEARVDGDLVVVTTSEQEGTFGLRYRITNERGATADGFVIVHVSPDAPTQYPIAIDHVFEPDDVSESDESLVVDARRGAWNPSGPVSDLELTVEGANAGAATVLEDGRVEVVLGSSRTVVAYRLTDPSVGTSAQAFIIVPPRYVPEPVVDELEDAEEEPEEEPEEPEELPDPPHLRSDLGTPNVPMNGEITWRLADLVTVPSGRAAKMFNPGAVTATRSDGSAVYVDQGTLRFAPEHGYRGHATVTFQVSDGDSADDPTGVSAVLTLRVTVGDPEFRDVAPEVTALDLAIEAGEEPTTFDLRGLTSHPNPAMISELTFTSFSGGGNGIEASLSGSTLTASAPFGVQPGTSAVVTFEVRFGQFTVPGKVTLRAVSSTRPPAQTVEDVEPEGRSSSTYTLDVLANDFNPFKVDGRPLKVIDAQFDGDSLGAQLSHTESTVTVVTGTAKSGTVSVIYTVADATLDPAREVTGRATVVVASAPEPVAEISLSRGGSGEILVSFQPTPSTNGAEVTEYRVRMTGEPAAAERTDCAPGQVCSFTGRTNGQAQTVTVAATNKVGTTWSTLAVSEIPYGVPAVPRDPRIDATNNAVAAANLTVSWSAPSNTGGGTVTYDWRFTRGSNAAGQTTGTVSVSQNAQLQGDYRAEVRACNAGGLCSEWAPTAVRTVAPPANPGGLSISKSTTYAPAHLTPRWNHVSNAGSGRYYEWRWTGGSKASTTGTSGSARNNAAAGSYSFEVRTCNDAGCNPSWVRSSTLGLDNPPPSGYVQDGGFIGYNPTDKNYWHWINICVASMRAGTYTLKFSVDSASNYKTISLQLPANGCVNTGQQVGTDTQNGVSSDWIQIEVVGQFTTPRYRPWT